MIYDANSLPQSATLKVDVCVVGTGAGGASVLHEAAKAGLRVVALEAGGLVTPDQMNQREETMFPKLYWEAGGRGTVDHAVKIHQGLGVGGSTLHNLNLCKRIPETILKDWAAERDLGALPLSAWAALYTEVEALLKVTAVPPGLVNRNNALLAKGRKALGWRGGSLRHNREGCVGSGFCELGCAYNAKNNALRVLIPPAVRAGAEIFTHAQACRVLHEGGRVTGVEAVVLDPLTRAPVGRFVVEASRVCVSASATGTAALLLRSDVPHPAGSVGDGLRIHPAVVVAGEFDEPVGAWRGIPQSEDCTELLRFDRADRRVWIVPAFAHPMGFATMLRGHGAEHRAMMLRYDRLAVLTAMVHDETAGTVRPDGELGMKIEYWPNASDRAQLRMGAKAAARLLFAAGAQAVYAPARDTLSLGSIDELDAFDNWTIEPGAVDITAVHPMSTVPMSDDPDRAAVDSRGRAHHLRGLWVADTSLFPTSLGVPPQLSTYAMGLHVGRDLVGA